MSAYPGYCKCHPRPPGGDLLPGAINYLEMEHHVLAVGELDRLLGIIKRLKAAVMRAPCRCYLVGSERGAAAIQRCERCAALEEAR